MARRRRATLAGSAVPLVLATVAIFNPFGIRDAAAARVAEQWQQRTEQQLDRIREQNEQRMQQVQTPSAPPAPATP